MKYDKTAWPVEYSSATDQGTDLEGEFWRAVQRAHAPRVSTMLAGLELTRHVQWGLALVDRVGPAYFQPNTDGRLFALITPMVCDGDLADLCAVKFWPKLEASDKLMKHLGLFERDNRQRQENIAIQVNLVGPDPVTGHNVAVKANLLEGRRV